MGSVGSFLSRAGVAAVALSLVGAAVAVADSTKVEYAGRDHRHACAIADDPFEWPPAVGQRITLSSVCVDEREGHDLVTPAAVNSHLTYYHEDCVGVEETSVDEETGEQSTFVDLECSPPIHDEVTSTTSILTLADDEFVLRTTLSTGCAIDVSFPYQYSTYGRDGGVEVGRHEDTARAYEAGGNLCGRAVTSGSARADAESDGVRLTTP